MSMQPDATATQGNPAPGWRASLKLNFAHSAGRTRLRRGAGHGPLYVQKPFYPEGAVCHLYLLHPPGGLVGGDEHDISVALEPGARVLLTTPAATKFYRSAGSFASQRLTLQLASDSCLEWLPQESLLFAGARARSATRVYLAPDCRFLGWEQTCLGRPAANEAFTWGEFDQRLELYATADHSSAARAAARPLLLERNHWRGGDPVLNAPWGLAGHGVAATLYATPVDHEATDMIRRKLAAGLRELHAEGSAPALRAALTLVDGVLVARVLGDEAQAVRGLLQDLWRELRPLVAGCAACPPRIWNT